MRSVRPGRAARGRAEQPRELIGLASRVIFAQAGMTTAIGLAYSRRNLPWLLVTCMLAVSLLLLAVAARSGTHAAWVTAVAFEAFFVVVGLYRFFYARYLGGTLLGIGALAFLLHPAVGRAFTALPGGAAGAQGRRDQRYDERGETEGLGEQPG